MGGANKLFIALLPTLVFIYPVKKWSKPDCSLYHNIKPCLQARQSNEDNFPG